MPLSSIPTVPQSARSSARAQHAGRIVLARRTSRAAAVLAIILSLCSCSVLTSFDSPAASPVEVSAGTGAVAGQSAAPAASLEEALAALVQTEGFSEGGLEHVLSGDINSKGQAVGYHSIALGQLAAGQIVPESASAADGAGLYEAQVTVLGTSKTGNDGFSTFFPDAWTAQQVVDAINEAYGTRVSSGDGGYDGVTSGGISVHMYVDDLGLITTAYPVMED